MNDLLLAEDCKKIDEWVAKFPVAKGAVLMALRIVQDRHGWLSDQSLEAVAKYLSLELVDVCEVASFYSMYRREQGGRHYVKVCTSLSCCLTGAYDVIDHLQTSLGVSVGLSLIHI